ncbi:MAG: transcription elongation factor GreA [Nocardioidaceae bacterium]|nr:transcription elongation factor GreA [Nocardioidaceae bacterium]MDX6310438.1 transcription elongation factor GreA [Nocardioidaceae bacterium]
MTQPTAENVIWLTQEAFDRLSAELENLKGPGRAAISRKIADAREEGDLRENGGYHAAREEQSKAESRIVQLEDMLTRAQVGETPKDDGIVEPGMQVTVRFADGDTETFLLGAREVLATDNSVEMSVYSPQSPLGAAIVGKRPGESASYKAPKKDLVVSVDIVEVKPFVG